MSAYIPPPPHGDRWSSWGERLNTWLVSTKDKLTFKTDRNVASNDGILLWDNQESAPVVSLGGEFIPLVLKDGHAIIYSNTNITAAAINTAYPIVWDGINLESGISLGTPASRIEFAKSGTYQLSFSVQITSTNSNLKDLWFWPAINGTDVGGSTLKVSIDSNGGTVVMNRTALFDVAAGDYLEAKWATSDTAVTLEAHAAETFCPATPSVTLSVARIHQ